MSLNLSPFQVYRSSKKPLYRVTDASGEWVTTYVDYFFVVGKVPREFTSYAQAHRHAEVLRKEFEQRERWELVPETGIDDLIGN